MIYRDDIITFHSPTKHQGLSPSEFLNSYIKHLKGNFFTSTSREKFRLIAWIYNHWGNQIIFVSRLFPNTLDTTKDGYPIHSQSIFTRLFYSLFAWFFDNIWRDNNPQPPNSTSLHNNPNPHATNHQD